MSKILLRNFSDVANTGLILYKAVASYRRGRTDASYRNSYVHSAAD